MNKFRKGQRVIIRGVMDLAGEHGTVASHPRASGAAWIKLDHNADGLSVKIEKGFGSSYVALFPYECDLEEPVAKT